MARDLIMTYHKTYTKSPYRNRCKIFYVILSAIKLTFYAIKRIFQEFQLTSCCPARLYRGTDPRLCEQMNKEVSCAAAQPFSIL